MLHSGSVPTAPPVYASGDADSGGGDNGSSLPLQGLGAASGLGAAAGSLAGAGRGGDSVGSSDYGQGAGGLAGGAMGGAGGPGQPEGAPDGAGGVVIRSTSAFSMGSTGSDSDEHDEERAALTEDGGAEAKGQPSEGREYRRPDRDVGAGDAGTQPAGRDVGLADPSNPEAAGGKGIPGGFNAGPALVERQPRRNMN